MGEISEGKTKVRMDRKGGNALLDYIVGFHD